MAVAPPGQRTLPFSGAVGSWLARVNCPNMNAAFCSPVAKFFAPAKTSSSGSVSTSPASHSFVSPAWSHAAATSLARASNAVTFPLGLAVAGPGPTADAQPPASATARPAAARHFTSRSGPRMNSSRTVPDAVCLFDVARAPMVSF